MLIAADARDVVLSCEMKAMLGQAQGRDDYVSPTTRGSSTDAGGSLLQPSLQAQANAAPSSCTGLLHPASALALRTPRIRQLGRGSSLHPTSDQAEALRVQLS
jgi:hypothetical protein